MTNDYLAFPLKLGIDLGRAKRMAGLVGQFLPFIKP